MTETAPFFEKLLGAFDSLGIPYMVAGSIASSFFGEARATNDIDIVIAPDKQQLDALVLALGGYYVSQQAAIQAFQRRSMFNVIDTATGTKADLILLKDRPFSIEEFKRRKPAILGNLQAWVVAPEDAILSKLEWAKEGQSERQFRDAVGVAMTQRDTLDLDYLRHWAAELDVSELLETLLREVKERRDAS